MDEIVEAFKEVYGKGKTQETVVTSVENGDKPTETVVESVKPEETIVEKSKPVETSVVFDSNDFNEKYGKKYGKEIKEEKELQELFTYPTKYTELESKFKTTEDTFNLTKKQLEDLQAEYESKKENLKFIDLKKYVGEDLLKISEMRKKYPDKDVAIMTQIGSMDLSKADPIDLLVKKARMNDSDIYSGMDDSQVKRVIASDFENVDLDDKSSWEDNPVIKAKVLKAAKEARAEFETLQKVELPGLVDVEKERELVFSKEKARVEQAKTQWSPIVDKMLSNFTELVIPDETGKEMYKYTPELNDSFKAEISQFVYYLAHTGQPINEKTITGVLEGIKGRYIARELPKIMKAHALSVSTKVNDEWHAKVHNDVPISDKTKPVDKGNDVWSKMESMI